MNTRRRQTSTPAPRATRAAPGFTLTPKARAHLVTRELDATIAATPRMRPVLVASELEPPAAPVETAKPRPRPRPAPQLNLLPDANVALDAAVTAALDATLPILRAQLRRELAAILTTTPNDGALR